MPEVGWQRYHGACVRWCEEIGVDDLIWEGMPWAEVEYAVHELSHAAILGHFPKPISLMRFVTETIDPMSWPNQVVQEVDASAVEYFVCQEIKIPFEKGDIVASLAVQNIPKDAVLSSLESKQPYMRQVAEVIEQLECWCKYD